MLKLLRPPDTLRRALVARGLGLVSTLLSVAGASTVREPSPAVPAAPHLPPPADPVAPSLLSPAVSAAPLLPSPAVPAPFLPAPAVPVDDHVGRAVAVLVLAIHGPAADGPLLDRIAGRVGGALDRPGRAERRGAGFLVLLPAADSTEAARVLNRIRFAVRQPVDLGGGRTARFGISAGVAARPDGAGTGLDALIAEADAALRREKRARIDA